MLFLPLDIVWNFIPIIFIYGGTAAFYLSIVVVIWMIALAILLAFLGVFVFFFAGAVLIFVLVNVFIVLFALWVAIVLFVFGTMLSALFGPVGILVWWAILFAGFLVFNAILTLTAMFFLSILTVGGVIIVILLSMVSVMMLFPSIIASGLMGVNWFTYTYMEPLINKWGEVLLGMGITW